jgi:hypothetical protein
VRTGGNTLIRQAISCDICATEKKLTNHWFVAHEQGGELRLTGWSSRNRLRPGSKHLCGQICLHKLVDEYMARIIEVRVQTASAEEAAAPREAVVSREAAVPREAAMSREAMVPRPIQATIPATMQATDASLTSHEAHGHPIEEFESSARLLTTPEPISPKRLPLRAPAELVAMPGRQPIEELTVPQEAPRYTSRNWRAEAWNREREREMGGVDRHTNTGIRRRSGS